MDEHRRPLLRVVSGSPTPEEIATIVAVLSAVGAGAGAEEPSGLARWSDRAALVRRPLPTGPGAWRASALPR